MVRLVPLLILSACYLPAVVRTAEPRPPTVADQLEAYVEASFRKDHFEGVVLIDQSGSTVYQRAIGLADRSWGLRHSLDGRFAIGAVTRSFTAALVTLLVKEGKLELDAPVSAYLPEVKGKAGTATLRQLLTHTGGYPRAPFPYLREDAHGLRKLVAHLDALTLSHPPGTRFATSELGYVVLGAVVEEVTGHGWEDELRHRLLEPLKLTCTGVERAGQIVPRHVRGYARAATLTPGAWVEVPAVDPRIRSAGAMYSCARDLVTWARTLARPDELFGPELAREFRTPAMNDFAFAWAFKDFTLSRERTVRAEGLTSRTPGSHLTVTHFPSTDTTLVMLGNSGSFPVSEVREGLVQVLNGLEPRLPRADLGVAVAGRLSQGKAAVDALLDTWRKDRDAYSVDEEALNAAGYEYLSLGRHADALVFFWLGVEAFPESGVAHDSLGEALLAAGDPDGARAHYRRALELDPGNDNARKVLASLGD